MMSNYLFLFLSLTAIGFSCQQEMSKLLVAGGRHGSLKTVEVIDLASEDKSCPNLPDLPAELIGPTGRLYNNSLPIICGSLSSVWEKIKCDCYALVNNEWTPYASPAKCGLYSETVILDSENVEGDLTELLLLAGGLAVVPLKSIEVFNGETWQQSQELELPEQRHLHCIIRINETRILLVGGTNSYGQSVAETHIYDSTTNKWTNGPSLKDGRSGHACGLLTLHKDTESEERIAVVVGGSTGYKYVTTTEILAIDRYGQASGEWSEGPKLPVDNLAYGKMIEFGESLVLVGGGGQPTKEFSLESEIYNGDKLFQLKSVEDKITWVEMKQKLKEERSQHVAFLIPDWMANC